MFTNRGGFDSFFFGISCFCLREKRFQKGYVQLSSSQFRVLPRRHPAEGQEAREEKNDSG